MPGAGSSFRWPTDTVNGASWAKEKAVPERLGASSFGSLSTFSHPAQWKKFTDTKALALYFSRLFGVWAFGRRWAGMNKKTKGSEMLAKQN